MHTWFVCIIFCLARPLTVVWPKRQRDGGKEGDFLDIAEPPTHLASIDASSHISAVAISPDATHLALSTSKKVCGAPFGRSWHDPANHVRTNNGAKCGLPYSQVSLCRLVIQEDDCQVLKLPLPDGIHPASHLKFTGDGSHLLLCGMDGLIQVVNVEEQKITAHFDQVVTP